MRVQNASVGPNGEGPQLLRVTDATGGSSRRGRGAVTNGWPRGSGSYNATRYDDACGCIQLMPDARKLTVAQMHAKELTEQHCGSLLALFL